MSKDAYMKLSVANMKKMVEGLEDLGEKKLEINGLPARRIEYEFKMGEFNIKGMTYIVSDNLSSHRSVTKEKVKLLIIDGNFLK